MSLNPGANTKDQVFKVIVEGEDWKPFEKADGLKVTIDGEETWYEPGSAFETRGGGNFKIADIVVERHGRVGRDAVYAKKFFDAAAKGIQLTGTGAYHDILGDGTQSARPHVAVNIVVNGVETGDVDSKSGARMYKYTFGVNGAPIA